MTCAWLSLTKTNETFDNANGLARYALQEHVSRHLTSLADVKRAAVEDYFEQIRNQILTLSLLRGTCSRRPLERAI